MSHVTIDGPQNRFTTAFKGTRALTVLPPPECKVYTSPELAGAMVNSLAPHRDQFWLDPCIGPGAFVHKLMNSGVPKRNIVGIDIDPCTGPADRWATTVRGIDFFTWTQSFNRRFSKIIANPPYVAIRKLHPTLQNSLQKVDEKNPAFSKRSNYWCAFLAVSLRLLEPGGDIAFVLPAAWEYASYARGLRQEILSSFTSVVVHRSLRPLFAEVQEGCVVLIAKSFQGKPEPPKSYVHADSAELVKALSDGPPKERLIVKAHNLSHPKTSAFSEIFSLRIGCVTGDASYFLLTEEERRAHGLPLSAVIPVVTRARQLAGAQIGFSDWDRLRTDGERIWLFRPDRVALRSKGVQNYLVLGEEQCDLKSYKLKNRTPWYQVPDVRTDAVGFMSGMTKSGPWLCLRSMRNLAATNTLYLVHEAKRLTVAQRSAWALSLLSSPVREQFHSIVRRYADGLPKLEPRDVSSLRLPVPNHFPGATDLYKKAIKALLSGQEIAATKLADEGLGISTR